MAGFIDFLINNYLIFLLITLVLIFALIGYLVETKKEAKGFEDKPKENDHKEKMLNIIKDKTEEEVMAEVKQMKNVSLNVAVGEKTNENTTPPVSEQVVEENISVIEDNNSVGEVIGVVPTSSSEEDALDNLTNADE